MSVQTGVIETNIPGRLDRLQWSRFHWMVVIGLGTVWILDGLEVTIVGSIASRLTEKGSGISIGAGGIGTAAAIYVVDIGWRIAFGLGAVLGLTIMLVRRHVPESPRWLFIHGKEDEAERIVSDIEQAVEREEGEDLEDVEDTIKVRQREAIPFRSIAKTAFKLYPRRAILGFALFVGQAFLYNGVTFNLGDFYSTFYGVSSSFVPVFIIVFAVGNFLGPFLLGRLFDTVGRIPMISGTYLGECSVSPRKRNASTVATTAWVLRR